MPLRALEARAEHISIEADAADAKHHVRGPHRVRAKLHWRNPLRGIEARFELADDHFLQVSHLQPRKTARRYTVDLRFCAPTPRRARHIAWLVLALSILLAAGAGTLALLTFQGTAPVGPHVLFGSAIALAALAAAGIALFFHRTTESLEFTSLYGQAALIRLLGGLGSGRRAKAFCIELIKSIHLAHATLDTRSQAYLRDAMREHHRLHESGVLSDGEYEASKRRILAAHMG